MLNEPFVLPGQIIQVAMYNTKVLEEIWIKIRWLILYHYTIEGYKYDLCMVLN